MCLKIEQILIGKQITEFEPKIYSTGVHLIPMKVEMNGKEKFIWVAEEFEGDTYFDGINISARVISNSIKELFSL
ncbi:MAG: hypothetical protein A2046_00865 [Bacteroidetes bacterium GWA2_30_7]|nr:MAG: hypothetical protein A2046_00865 [Bacteroidetes bacterium GWA2_30_7]